VIIIFIEALTVVVLAMILSMIFIDEKKNRLRNMRAVKLKGYWDGGERRSTTRLNITLEVKYFKNGQSGNVRAADISTKGLRLLLDEKIEKETSLRLEIKLPGQERLVRTSGRVVWIEESREDEKPSAKRLFNTGVEFLKFHETDNKRLFDFIHNIDPQKR